MGTHALTLFGMQERWWGPGPTLLLFLKISFCTSVALLSPIVMCFVYSQ